MQTNIEQRSEVEYELHLDATADDLADAIKRELRKQRARLTLKGFRPGKVPLPLAKKLVGKEVAYGVAEARVQEVYEDLIIGSDDYEVLGQPAITTLDYQPDGDLHAVIRFGVRPTFELADLEGASVAKLVHALEETEVDEELERLREREADLAPVDDAAIEADDYVVVDMQGIDAASGTPLIGQKDEDVAFMLNHPSTPESLKEALLGKQVGDAVRVEMPHDHDHDHGHDHDHDHTHTFEVTVKEVKRPELPELDDEFVQSVTKERFDNLDDLKAEIRKELTAYWERQSREMFESEVVGKMIELHPIPVPASVIELYLDSFVEEVKQNNDGNLPDNFDERYFRFARRAEAERQARWMFIRDKLIAEENIEVSEDDREQFFERSSEGELSGEQLRQFYNAIPQLRDQMEQRLLSEKVFDTLSDRMEVREMDREEFEAELDARREEARAKMAEAQAVLDAADADAEADAEAADADAPAAEAAAAEAPAAEAAADEEKAAEDDEEKVA